MLVPAGIVWRLPWMAAAVEHVIQLCVDHGITVRRSGPSGGRADIEQRTIAIPMLTDPSAYGVALHEIAHIVDPGADSRQHRHTETTTDRGTSTVSPRGEAAAWSWAVRTATKWTREMQDCMSDSLRAYAPHVRSAREADAMTAVLRAGALAIADAPLTFAELEKHCHLLLGACPPNSTSDQTPSASVTRTTTEPDIAALAARVNELESRPAFADRGVWDATTTYQPGHGVTFRGSFWLAQRETRGDQPGADQARSWRLAVKRGKDGKDLR
jgi:hypothetical protein